MTGKKINIFTTPEAVTVSLYVYAFVVSLFLSFSISTWIFGFVITNLGGTVEYFMAWLLFFGIFYVFCRFASIGTRVKAVIGSEKPEETVELKALSAWFLSFTAAAIVAALASGFFAENLVFKEIQKANDKGLNISIIQKAAEGRQGINAAEKLNSFLFSQEGQPVRLAASIAVSLETFAYFLERKWTTEETGAAAALVLANKEKMEPLKAIIRESGYLQAVKLPLPAQKDLNLLTPYGYSLLEEYARQLAIEVKLSAMEGREKQAAESMKILVKMYELLKSGAGGLMSGSAAIKVQAVISPAFGAMMSYDKAYRLLKPVMTGFINTAGNGLTRSGLREETALLMEKYRLIKKNPALIKHLTGLSGPLVSLASVTGALDISFYRLIKDFSEAAEGTNIREHKNVKQLSYWPYMFTKKMEPDLKKFYRDEETGFAALKALNAICLIKEHGLKTGKLPGSIYETLTYLPEGAGLDPFGNKTLFLIIHKNESMILYSLGEDRVDNSGSLADGKDIGHVLFY